jgi:hypothetical protein
MIASSGRLAIAETTCAKAFGTHLLIFISKIRWNFYRAKN